MARKEAGALQYACAAVVLLCALYIVYSWWVSERGPAWKDRYRVQTVSFTDTPQGGGQLALNLATPPLADLRGGAVVQVDALTLEPNNRNVTGADARKASALLPAILLQTRVADSDPQASVLRFLLTPAAVAKAAAAGWPHGPGKTPWVMDVAPAKKGLFPSAEGTIRLPPPPSQ